MGCGCGSDKKKPAVLAPIRVEYNSQLEKNSNPPFVSNSPTNDSLENRSKQPTIELNIQETPPKVDIKEIIDVNPQIYEESGHKLYALKNTADSDELIDSNWENIIYHKPNQKVTILELLNKKPRNWVEEQIKLGLDGYADACRIPSFKQVRKPLLLQQQFNKLIWAIGSYFFENDTLQLSESEINFLPAHNSKKWIEGFEWNGIYVRILLISEHHILKNEAQAIKYLSMEIQHHLAFNSLKASEQDATVIVNNLLLPLLSYVEKNGIILYGSPLIPRSDTSYIANMDSSLPQIGMKGDTSNIMSCSSPEAIPKEDSPLKRDSICFNRHLPLISSLHKSSCLSLHSNIKNCCSMVVGAYSSIPLSILNSNMYFLISATSNQWILLDESRFSQISTIELRQVLNYKGAKSKLEDFQKLYKEFYGWSLHITSMADNSLPINTNVKFFCDDQEFRGDCLLAISYFKKPFKKCYGMLQSSTIGIYETNINDAIYDIKTTDLMTSHKQAKELLHKYGLNLRFEWVLFDMLKEDSIQKSILASDIIIRSLKALISRNIETEINKADINASIPKKAECIFYQGLNEILHKFKSGSICHMGNLDKQLISSLLRIYPSLKHFTKDVKSPQSILKDVYAHAVSKPLVFLNGLQHHFKIRLSNIQLNKVTSDSYCVYKEGLSSEHFSPVPIQIQYPFTFNEFSYLMLAIYMNQKMKTILNSTSISPILSKKFSNFRKKANSNCNVNNENGAKPLQKEPSFTFRYGGVGEIQKKFSCDITASLNQSSGISPQKIIKLSKNILKANNKNVITYRKKCTESVILERTVELMFPSILYNCSPEEQITGLLKRSYYIPSPDTINDFVDYLENIAPDFHTYDSNNTALIEALIVQALCFAFIIKDLKKAQAICAKMNEKAAQMNGISLGLDLTLNIMHAILNENPDNVKESMNLYSQCIANCFKVVGDPRGKGNYTFALMLLPLWRYLKYCSSDKRLQEKELALELLEAVEYSLNSKRRSMSECITSNSKSNLPFNQWYCENSNLTTIYESFPDNNKGLLSWIFTNLPYYIDTPKAATSILIEGATPVQPILPPIVSTKKGITNLCDLSLRLANEGVAINKGSLHCMVYSWGSNQKGQLAINFEEEINAFVPKIIVPLKDLYIKQICCGHSFTLAVTDTNEVYSWGENEYSQLGFGDTSMAVSTPRKIPGLSNVQKVSCGSEHSVALTNDKKLYIWGQNQDGVLGTGSKQAYLTPTLLTLSNVKDVVCGGLHTIALNFSGQLYSWGKGEGGQLGLDISQLNEDFSATTPTLIEKLKEIFIVEVACGEAHSLALAKDGNLYGWGYTNYGQLGLGISDDTFQPGTGNVESKIDTPVLVSVQDVKIEHIYCGYTFTLLITDKGGLIGCGSNDLGQLGIEVEEREVDIKYQGNGMPKPKTKDILSPTSVEALENIGIKSLSCGENHVIAIAKDGLALSWGAYNKGQLGLGDVKKLCPPRPVQLFSGCNIQEVSCGASHSAAIIGGRRELIPKSDWDITLPSIICN